MHEGMHIYIASAICIALLLASCAPRGHAVGDTQDTQATISHDYINLGKTGTITDGGIVFDAIRMLPDDSAGTATPSDAICHRDPLS
ncbi:hypothetical protein PSRA_0156 [Pseudoscardovia radai]|uniref:Uncharacterized protein n=1 Tax=Pseudoscardovia radai TaxID=987066 RepID=A0A261F2J5_9BIFI|nr:hypothetical protein PSRA_0156 [Pseudoscardovia radai]